MASIVKRDRGNKSYYYLEHSFRLNGKIMKEEKYLGDRVPKNINRIKNDFLTGIYHRKWYIQFDKIKAAYKTDIGSATTTEKEKEIEEFMIRFTYDTQRIEGSTLSLKETANLLQHGITPANKPNNDVKEAEAHSRLFYKMLDYKKDLTMQLVLEWHYNLLESTKKDIAGRIRTRQVWILGSKFIPPSPVEVTPLFEDLFRWYNKNKGMIHPVELAATMHLRFVTTHPFIDGNGRLSRLIMNFILKKSGYPMLNIPYKNRASYYNALERAQVKKVGSVFVSWFFRRYIKDYKKYLKP